MGGCATAGPEKPEAYSLEYVEDCSRPAQRTPVQLTVLCRQRPGGHCPP